MAKSGMLLSFVALNTHMGTISLVAPFFFLDLCFIIALIRNNAYIFFQVQLFN